MTDKQFVHTFGFPLDDVGVLGVRGAHLAQLAALDVPVPPGFTVGTAAWHLRRLLDDPQAQVAYEAQLDAAIEQLELDTGSALDDPSRPLIVSVTASGRRAVGPPSTQPIDVGLSDRVVQRLAGRTDREFALVVYDEMIQAFCVRVRGLDPAEVAAATAGASRQASIGSLHALLAARGDGWPERARDQLAEAIDALLRAAPRPTAVVVQARVFGVADGRSGVGTAYTREPVSGAGDPAGEFRVRDEGGPVDILALQRSMPAAGADLGRALARVEVVHRDMCEVGFVVEEGQLWVDAAEPGGRSSEAAVRIAVDLVDGGLIDVEVALDRVPLSALAEMRGERRASTTKAPRIPGIPTSPSPRPFARFGCSATPVRSAGSGRPRPAPQLPDRPARHRHRHARPGLPAAGARAAGSPPPAG